MIYRGVHPLAPRQTRASATSETAAKYEGRRRREQVGTNERRPTEYWQDCEHGERGWTLRFLLMQLREQLLLAMYLYISPSAQ
jgi:hypothetical protein